MTDPKKTRKVIGLWLDTISDPEQPAWIVSRDHVNAAGRADSTKTLAVYPAGCHAEAFAHARRLADAEGVPVVDEDGPVYAPTALIEDGGAD